MLRLPPTSRQERQLADFIGAIVAPQRERKLIEADLRTATGNWDPSRPVLLPQ